MQTTFLDVDSIDDIDTVDTAYHSHELRGYIKERFSRTLQAVKENGSRVLDNFMNRTKEIFDRYNGADALARTRRSIRNMKGLKNPNIIQYLDTIEQFRSTGLAMQRFIMADPVIRKEYHLQRLDGYSDTYVDIHKSDIGFSHYDYRRATNGIYIKTKDEEGNEVFENTRYYEFLVEGDRELDFEEQVIIQDAWAIQRMFVQSDIDPTDPNQ